MVKAGAIVLLTFAIELVIQDGLPGYRSDPLVTSLALVALRTGMCILLAANYGRYLGMWRRISGGSAPWMIAAVVFVPALYVAAALSSEAGMLARSPQLTLLCLTTWVAIAWSARDVGGAIDAWYMRKNSSAIGLERTLTGLPTRISQRGDMIGLDVAMMAASAAIWYVVKVSFTLST
jgi:hypothetical protein